MVQVRKRRSFGVDQLGKQQRKCPSITSAGLHHEVALPSDPVLFLGRSE